MAPQTQAQPSQPQPATETPTANASTPPANDNSEITGQSYLNPEQTNNRLQLEKQRQNISTANIRTDRRTIPGSFPISYAEAAHQALEVYSDLTFKKAMASPDKDEWSQTLIEEYSNLISLDTFQEVFFENSMNVIDSKLIMHRKTDGRFRPRLCAIDLV
jgi:hypothetical protein